MPCHALPSPFSLLPAPCREKGVEQFLSIYNKNRDLKDDVLMWGDEVEYIIMKVSRASFVLSCRLKMAERSPKVKDF
jgi:glutamate--cysteine ligase catalytic subunit